MDHSGLSRYRIAKDCGIDPSALGKFYHGERGLSTEAMDAIGQLLQLRIVTDRKVKKGK